MPWKLVLRRPREMRTDSREGGHDLPVPSPEGFSLSRQKRKEEWETQRWTLGRIAHPDQFKKEEGKDGLYGLFCSLFWKP